MIDGLEPKKPNGKRNKSHKRDSSSALWAAADIDLWFPTRQLLFPIKSKTITPRSAQNLHPLSHCRYISSFYLPPCNLISQSRPKNYRFTQLQNLKASIVKWVEQRTNNVAIEDCAEVFAVDFEFRARSTRQTETKACSTGLFCSKNWMTRDWTLQTNQRTYMHRQISKPKTRVHRCNMQPKILTFSGKEIAYQS